MTIDLVAEFPQGNLPSIVSVTHHRTPTGAFQLHITEHFLDQEIPMREIGVRLPPREMFRVMRNLLDEFLTEPTP